MTRGKYIICIKPYKIDSVCFDYGYIEKWTSARPLSNDDNWRTATDKEVENFFNTETVKRPNGRYYDYTP